MITILTPTYNRVYTLERLYKSLCLQSIPFEWLIIDDGSTDTTHELVASFQDKSFFPIHYIHQSNSGKHVAINTGTSMAKGEFIFIVDSDDALTQDALILVRHALNSLTQKEVGISFRRASFEGKIIGNKTHFRVPLVLSPTDASNLFQGDLAYIFRTSALLSHPFPIIRGETFVPELLLWNRIADEGDILYYPTTAIYQCEYLADGYSANFNQNLRKNPKGFALFYRDQFFREKTLIRKIKCAVRYLQCRYYGTFR
ncbi:MAG: glycosyltransferase family 2 protein [Sulfuricurvum sp.]